jgi:hypothetical protein
VARQDRPGRPRLRLDRLEDRTLLSVWIEQGPGPVNAPDFTNSPSTPAGAIQAIAADPTNANVVFVGSVNGGVWKTTNATAASPHWTPLTDQALPGLSIDSLAVSPVDPNTLYAGTASLSAMGGAGSSGYGLARSHDGGATWSVVAASTFTDERLHNIVPTQLAGGNVILADAELAGDPQRGLFLPAGGVYRSSNGGTSFTRISGAPGSGLPDQAVSDLVADPSNPSRFYAAVPLNWFTNGPYGQATPTGNEGIYRSDDGGLTWARVSTGIPGTSTAFRMLLAVHNSPGNDVVYAAVIAQGPIDLVSGDLQGVYRSTNLGATWTSMGVPSDPVFPKGQGAQLHGSIVADPNNPNVVFLGGDGAFLGGNGTSGLEGCLTYRGDASLSNPWTRVVGAGANGTAAHADTRAMAFDANGNILQANDGGLYRLVDPNNPATRHWVSVNGDIRTTEFHSVAYDPVSHVVFGGAQDNGSITQVAPGGLAGLQFTSGDGGVVAVDADQAAHPGTSIRYSSYQSLGGFARTTVDANNVAGHPNAIRLKIVAGPGQGKKLLDYDPNIGFFQPFVLNAVDPTRMLITTQNIYESFDQGDSLNDLGSFGVTIGAPGFIDYGENLAYGGRLNGVANPDVFYAGAASPGIYTGTGEIYHRAHAGDPVTALTAYPGGTVISLAIDPQDYRRVYVVDEQNRVWASFNEGAAWTELTANLHSLTIDPLGRTIEVYSASPSPADDVLMVGNLGGVFAMAHPGTPGATWSVLGSGLPHALAIDLHYDYTDNVLLAGTLGRGAWTLSNPFAPVMPPTLPGLLPPTSSGLGHGTLTGTGNVDLRDAFAASSALDGDGFDFAAFRHRSRRQM